MRETPAAKRAQALLHQKLLYTLAAHPNSNLHVSVEQAVEDGPSRNHGSHTAHKGQEAGERPEAEA